MQKHDIVSIKRRLVDHGGSRGVLDPVTTASPLCLRLSSPLLLPTPPRVLRSPPGRLHQRPHCHIEKYYCMLRYFSSSLLACGPLFWPYYQVPSTMKFRPLSIDYQLQGARHDDSVRGDRLARNHGAVRVIQKVVTPHASVVHAVPVREVLTVHHQVDERHDHLRRELDGDEEFPQPAILLDAPGDVFEPHHRRAAGFRLEDPGDVPMRLLLPRQHRRGRAIGAVGCVRVASLPQDRIESFEQLHLVHEL